MKSTILEKVLCKSSASVRLYLACSFLLCLLVWTGGPGCTDKNEVKVNAGKLSDPSFLQGQDETEPFATGIILHNVYPAFLRDELAPLKKAGLVVMDEEQGFVNLDFPAQKKIGPVQCLAVQKSKNGSKLWVGTSFDGVYVLDFPSLSISAHYTVESTGITGRAVSMSKKKLVFEPDTEVKKADLAKLSSLAGSGLYLKLNTEFFHVRSMDWPAFTVHTYGSHYLDHSGKTGSGGMDKVTVVSGLPDNTINDIMVSGDTVWVAAGRLGDKGLAGGIVSFRNGEFTPRHPNSVFNKRRRFNFQRSNAGYSLCKHGDKLWSGWAEIRGPKPWGGVSGNVLNFSGDGGKKKQWNDFTNPACINPRNFSSRMHVTVDDLAPVRLREGETLRECVAAASFGLNTITRMGTPGRRSSGGGGLRIICPEGLKGFVFKEYGEDQKPVAGSPPSNAVFAVDTMHEKGSDRVYAFAGTDAGLYVSELTSRVRRYFYEPPENPAPVVWVGSDYSLGFYRSGEVLHGMTVGSASWPPCLPDLMVNEISLLPGSDKDNLKLWVGTYGGAAFYNGPLDSITDCSRWKKFYYHEDTGRILSSKKQEQEIKTSRGLATVSALLAAEQDGRRYVVVGLNKETMLVGQAGALKRALRENAKRFPQSPVNDIRLHRSTAYENALETTSLPDFSALNLYTRQFHEKECTIQNPECLSGDTSLNWRHFDAMMNRVVKNDLRPAICLSTLPVLMYKDLVKEGDCSPPDPDNPACAPSRTKWDLSKWENLVFAVVDRLYRRYGREEAAGWTLEVWNEPAIAWEWRWNQSWASDYAVLFSHTREAVQACNRAWDRKIPRTRGMDIRLAGPAWHGDPKPPDKRLKKMIETFKENNLSPDLFTIHIYPFKRMSMGPYYERAIEYMKEKDMTAPLYVTEYGPVMTQCHDGIGTLASGELSAIFLLQSLHDLYGLTPPPKMMHFLEIQSLIFGARSNWAGMYSYLGANEWAPRPVFNAMTMAAQAGPLQLPVQAKGELDSFGRYDPRTGKIMLFMINTDIQKLWQKTKNYNQPGRTSLQLQVEGLPEKQYKVREFVIDSSHNNFLTAHWKEGSPSAPAKDVAEKIRRDSSLKPLGREEAALPQTIEGSSIHATLSMEKESIYTIELSPPPVLGVSGNIITGLDLSADEQGDVRVSWQAGRKEYKRSYRQRLRSWQKTESNKVPEKTSEDEADPAGFCTAVTRFNGDTIKIGLRRDKEGELPVLQASTPGSNSIKVKSHTVNLGSWDQKTLACAADGKGRLHLVSGEKDGTLVYRKLRPFRKSSGLTYNIAGPPRRVSAYGPYPARRPDRPAIAVDKKGNVHIVWIERDPQGLGISGRNAVVYTYLREG